MRPDFIFILSDICVFRGEEKQSREKIDVPRAELSGKQVWTYGNVPYMLVYAATGMDVELVALELVNSKVQAVKISRYNLISSSERLRLMLALLNMCRLFQDIIRRCPAIAEGEYQSFLRSTCTVMLDSVHVQRVYLDPNLYEKFAPHFDTVYKMLKANNVPNVDRLAKISQKQMRFVFEPRGDYIHPENLAELFCALADVLEALVALHGAGWCHRDIRWPNVIRNRSTGKWFLIDFEYAAAYPQCTSSELGLKRDEHAPEMFVNGGSHGAAVDIRAVGLLIDECPVFIRWDNLNGRTNFKRKLMHPDPSERPTAMDALQELKNLKETAKDELSQIEATAESKADEDMEEVNSKMQPRKRHRV